MAATVMQGIRSRYEDFSPSLRKIADYLLSHPAESQYLSITELASECGVGKASVSRFCKALGFDGYNYLKLALARSSVIRPEAVVPADGAADEAEAVRAMARDLLAINVRAMEETLQLLDGGAVARASELLWGASDVYCFGQGGSMVLAMEAWSRFLTISPKFRVVEDTHLQIMSASLMGKSSVILFVSYSGATADSLDVLKPARKQGAKVILITRHKNSPAAEYADEVLQCGGMEGPLETGSAVAKMSTLLVIDVLFNEYCRKDPQGVLHNRDTSADALSRRML